MKALSIRQPWAWRILHQGKDVENRTWRTHLRGKILIHTGATPDYPKRLWPDDDVPFDAPMGGIVGSVEIVDCVQDSDSEWFVGPWGFVLRNPTALPETANSIAYRELFAIASIAASMITEPDSNT